MESAKSKIIERLFGQRWDASRHTLSQTEVALEDVTKAIREYNKSRGAKRLSDKNPANFFKDFIRKRRSANLNWPKSVFKRGYTARQTTGGGACFEFTPIAPGQREPFPQEVVAPEPGREPRLIESASLPLASRRLGRSDEPWLVQVLVRLRVIETHLSIASKRRMLQVDHLQMSVKLRKAEIDALFLGVEQVSNEETQELIICCEAKAKNDDILVDQIVRQVQGVFELELKQNLVLPMAVKATGPSEVFVVEFDVVGREEAKSLTTLSVASSELYKFKPTVPGIGK